MWSNFHTHSHYCDGKGTVKDYLEAAKTNQVGQIGMSSHAPLPFPCKWCMKQDAFPEYLREIEAAKQSFPDVEVYTGLEVDFIPGIVSPADFASSVDYTIGSVHFVNAFEGRYWEIDNTFDVFKEGLTKIFHGNIRAAISRYYQLTRDMMITASPNILGHLDKIKINAEGTFFEESEPWYVEEIDKTLEALRETASMVEVNTRGIYKKKSRQTYPSTWILERILRWNIPITLSSDAHHPDDLTREFPPTLQLLEEIGFKNISVLKCGIWKNVPLNEYGPGR